MCQETKTCKKCGQIKPIDDYYVRNKKTGCRRTECKLCWNAKTSAWGKADYQANKSYYKTKNAAWFAANREYMRRQRHQRYIDTKDEVREQERLYKQKRRQTDPTYRLVSACRQRCRAAVLEHKTHKAARTLDMLGCSPEELREHLEKQFYYGMTWDTFGNGPCTWQIDHIEPVGMFDLTDPEQQKRCFHYTNLQPLWWNDHQRKSITDNMRIRNTRALLTNLWTLDQIRAASASV